MAQHFNQLTAGELERLAIASEEMAEAQKEICKILRHGFASYNPTIPNSPLNRENLATEIGHVLYALERLMDFQDVSVQLVETSRMAKRKSIAQYLHHADEL